MKHSAEMRSGAMIYMLSFINMCSGIEKLMGGGIQRHTDINLPLFFQNKGSSLNWGGSVTVLPEFFELYLSMYMGYS
jgi:hypothetical protein